MLTLSYFELAAVFALGVAVATLALLGLGLCQASARADEVTERIAAAWWGERDTAHE